MSSEIGCTHLVEALKVVHLTNQAVDFEKLRVDKEELPNAGSLIQWDGTHTWYTPLQEHFPVIGREPQGPALHMRHYSWDVSAYQLNEAMPGCVVVYEVLSDAVRAALVAGRGPVTCYKRSSNNYMDVLLLGRRIEISYNNSHVFSGQIANLPLGAEQQDMPIYGHESVIGRLHEISESHEITDITYVFGLPSKLESEHYQVLCTEEGGVAALWKGVEKQKEREERRGGGGEVVEKAKRILGLTCVPDQDRRMFEYGLDSLMSTEILDMLQDRVGRVFSNADIMNLSFRDLEKLVV